MKPEEMLILIVDDEPDFRDALAFSFTRKGYRVLTASNGNEAFDLIQSNPVDVVISDVMMPHCTGTDLLDRMKKAGPSMPVILLATGFADLSSEEAHQKGAEALFSKPVDRKALVEMVTLLLTARGHPPRTSQSKPGVSVSLRFQGVQQPVQAQIVDLGRNGMSVAVQKGTYPNVNDDVAFQILLGETGSSLDGVGITKWVRTKDGLGLPTGCGIEFTHMTERDRRQILDFIALSKASTRLAN